MTADLFDLGMRLAAAAAGEPAARLTGAPLTPPAAPVAVRARLHRGVVSASAAVPGQAEQHASGLAVLGLLERLGVLVTATPWRTLVVQDDQTLPALLASARADGGGHAATAAHIAWWADRADFPGGGGVVPLLRACRQRWVTGTAPAEETRARTWRAWLRVPGNGCPAMLGVLARVQAGAPLPLLGALEADTAGSWETAQAAFAAGADWRRPDSVARAAAGLWAREDSAALYAAALLRDPLYRRRAAHTGHVVTGTVSSPDPKAKTVAVTCDRPDGRLREGDEVTGWTGPLAARPGQVFRGRVTGAVIAGGTLTLDVACGRSRPAPAARVTLHPVDPVPGAMIGQRERRERLYRTASSWLASGREPGLERREIPLEVLIAGAGD